MPWLKVDDGFAEHPKVLALEVAERWAWLEVLLYSARRRSRTVSRGALERCGFDEDGVAELVRLELLEDVGEGAYDVHDWDVYNGARTDAERKREQRARDYGADYYGLPVGEHGGRRGSYASRESHEDVTTEERDEDATDGLATSSHGTVTAALLDVTTGERDGSVSITRGRSRTPTPREHKPLALDDARASGLTEAEVVAAREDRRRSGWVENLSSYTGCRYVRGTHGVTAVYDVLGQEPAPAGWDHPRPTRAEVADALERQAELERAERASI